MRHLLPAAVALMAAGAAQASAPAPAPPPPGLSAVPQAAPAAEGHVVLRCKVTAERTLEGCAVASETPAGHGLGQAALNMAKQVKINDGTFKPEMVGRTLEIPMRFAQDAAPEDEEPLAKMP